MKKRKIKSTYDLIKEVRSSWLINPKTRVKENERKNVKKLRQKSKKVIMDYRKGDNKSPYFILLAG